MHIRKAAWSLNIFATHAKKELCKVIDVLTNLAVVIILQYIHISNHDVLHLKHTQYYMSTISQESWEKRKKSSVSIPGSNEMEEKKPKCITV